MSPVRLQHNSAVVWHTVASWDDDNRNERCMVQYAVELLGAVNPDHRWRVLTNTGLPAVVLRSWSGEHGWRDGE